MKCIAKLKNGNINNKSKTIFFPVSYNFLKGGLLKINTFILRRCDAQNTWSGKNRSPGFPGLLLF